MTRRSSAAAVLLLLLAACSTGAPPASSRLPAAAPSPAAPPSAPDGGFALTVENIMRGELLVGRSPSEVRWSPDSRSVFFRWREPEAADTATATYRFDVGTGASVRLRRDSVPAAAATTGSWSEDRRARAVIHEGDVWVVDTLGVEQRVTHTAEVERQPHLSPDAATVYFMGGGNLFALSLAQGELRQLTDFRDEDAPEDASPEGQRAFLEGEQERLFGSVRERNTERERREALEDSSRTVPRSWLGPDTRVASAQVSPTGRYALIAVTSSADPERTMVADFVTESGYTEQRSARPKVGDLLEGDRAAIVELASGEVRWIEPEPLERDLRFTPIGWAPDQDRALLVAVAGDHKDRWILTAAPDGSTRQVDHLHDPAWVGGPGLYTAGWLPSGERIYFISERSGFAHLYTAPAAGGGARALTTGNWEVTDVQLASGGDRFFLTTSEAHPGERHLYAVPVGGGPRTRLTSLDGWSEATVAPNGGAAAIVHARANQPPELYFQELTPAGTARRLTHSTTPEFARGPWIEPEIVLVAASDGVQVPARIYRPRDLGAVANGAAVIFVHGAGYLQNVHRGWSSYFREYMFHHLLASRGYVVLDMDYRGSAGYGRDWRTAIYRHMGGRDLADHVDGARWLVANEGVDAGRVGIYGGSYGGFITLMALFTEAEHFRAGAALRSVTDWAHYNEGYTSRILNRPQDDPEAYRRSSPIYFAEGLQGHLLIAHGMLDVNVHFQDVVRLVQRLIELGKPDWELAVYPVEDHAFTRPESWIDEYRRVLELFERTLASRAGAM